MRAIDGGFASAIRERDATPNGITDLPGCCRSRADRHRSEGTAPGRRRREDPLHGLPRRAGEVRTDPPEQKDAA